MCEHVDLVLHTCSTEGIHIELCLIFSQRLFYSSPTHTYMLTLFTHDCVGQLAYKNAVNKVHLHTFLSVC